MSHIDLDIQEMEHINVNYIFIPIQEIKHVGTVVLYKSNSSNNK